MLNIFSMIGELVIAVVFGDYVFYSAVKIVVFFLECFGEVYVIKEEQMDIFIGIVGSGLVYFYYLMEFIEKVGEDVGLDKWLFCKIGV